MVIWDMNASVRDTEVQNVVGKFGVPGRNEDGGKLINVCMGKKSGKHFFVNKYVHKLLE